MPETLKELVNRIVKDRSSTSVEEVKRILKRNMVKCSDEELQAVLRELQSEGSLSLVDRAIPASFAGYLSSYRSWWIYAVVLASVSEVLLVADPRNSMLGSLRTILGLALLGFLPGYSSQRALFPGEELRTLERILLSIFLSVAVSIGVGLSLGSVFLFAAGPNAVLLSAYVVVATLVAGYRSFMADRKRTIGLLRT